MQSLGGLSKDLESVNEVSVDGYNWFDAWVMHVMTHILKLDGLNCSYYGGYG